MPGRLARLVFAIGAVAVVAIGPRAAAQGTSQGQNASQSSAAESGSSGGNNVTALQAGPSSSGPQHAAAQQMGGSSGSVSQSGDASTGGASAGSQANARAGSGSAQLQSSAQDPSATSGDADADNEATIRLGPQATGTGGAQVAQTGTNSVDAEQALVAATGDAVAGSQLIEASGDGDHVFQAQNESLCALACGSESGIATASNMLTISIGPLASSTGFTDGTSAAAQVGDNDATIRQSSTAATGDALYGSQAAAIAGGSARGQLGNHSSCARFGSCAASGDAGAANTAVPANNTTVAGPVAMRFVGTALASQFGSDAVTITQSTDAASGDALSGSQVVGYVGDAAGHLRIQDQQASEDDFAASGDAVVVNAEVGFELGPHAEAGSTLASQIGADLLDARQTATAESGDALAATQAVAATGGSMVEVAMDNQATGAQARTGAALGPGFVNVVFVAVGPFASNESALLLGPALATVWQSASLLTGAATAASQLAALSASSAVTVQEANASSNALASSGAIESSVFFFPLDVNLADVSGPGLVTQRARLETGDGTAGAEVTAVTAGRGAAVSVQNSNAVEDSFAFSGFILALDFDNATVSEGTIDQQALATTGDAVAGSQLSGVTAGDAADVGVQSQNLSDVAFTSSGSIAVNTANLALSAEQVVQAAILGTGDAVAGSQVTGTESGDGSSTLVDLQDNAVDSTALSGPIAVRAVNDMELPPFPSEQATSFEDFAFVSQSADVSTGDAVAGGQVTGVATGDGSAATISAQSATSSSRAVSGDFDAIDGVNLATISLGPSGFEQASQLGGNIVELDQRLDVSTGDAVAGSQVTGVAAGADGPVAVQIGNACVALFARCAEAVSGDIGEASNFAVLTLGPDAPQAQQLGPNDADIEQVSDTDTGDAVSGAQVTGTTRSRHPGPGAGR